jgi:hypothetical protein
MGIDGVSDAAFGSSVYDRFPQNIQRLLRTGAFGHNSFPQNMQRLLWTGAFGRVDNIPKVSQIGERRRKRPTMRLWSSVS